MKVIKNSFLLILFIGTSFSLAAQPPGGGRPGGGRPGGSPEETVKREKQTLYSKVDDLTDDQKLLLDGIYEEFVVTLEEGMKELRESNDREGRREKMQALRKEKDTLIADVLNEDQFKIYQSISTSRRERRGNDEGGNQN